MQQGFFRHRDGSLNHVRICALVASLAVAVAFAVVVTLIDQVNRQFEASLTAEDRTRIAAINKELEEGPPLGSLLVLRGGSMYFIVKTEPGMLVTYRSVVNRRSASIAKNPENRWLYNVERIVRADVDDAVYAAAVRTYAKSLE